MKVEVGVFLEISKEVDLELPENYTMDDVYEAFDNQYGFPPNCYDYITGHSDDWLINNVDILETNGYRQTN